MMTGPSVGPAMVLLVLMRWPILIIVFALGGSAFVLHDKVDFDQVRKSMYSTADNMHIPLRQFMAGIGPELGISAAHAVPEKAPVPAPAPSQAAQ